MATPGAASAEEMRKLDTMMSERKSTQVMSAMPSDGMMQWSNYPQDELAAPGSTPMMP